MGFRLRVLWAVVLSSGCGVVADDALFSPNPDDYVDMETGSGGAGTGSGTGVGAGAAGDLPCDVVDVLAAHCDICHAANIPPLLRSHADFLAPASDSAQNMAEASLARMQNSTDPMPPSGVPPFADAQVFADWLAAGLPAGDCGSGAGGAGGSPYDTPPTCTSGQTWNDGDNGGQNMYPGQACNACHAREKPDKIFAFAGTVYPTAHEPDDCIGVGSGVATVEITDDNGVVASATTNTSGNFTINGNFAFPVTVRVLAGNKVLPMAAPLQPADGDCNTCHNQDGANDAPGRIILPF